MRTLMTSTMLALMLAAAGCTTTQKGAAIGTAIGAGAGAIIGHQSGHRTEGAVIGGAAGALGGAAVGHHMDYKKYCPKCGKKYSNNDTYCATCGVPLKPLGGTAAQE
jgi:uncharacterized protein YcfJ